MTTLCNYGKTRIHTDLLKVMEKQLNADLAIRTLDDKSEEGNNSILLIVSLFSPVCSKYFFGKKCISLG